MHDAAGSLKKESLREAVLGMLGWDKTVGDGFAGSMTGSEICICRIGLVWDSDQTRMSLVLMVMTH